MRRGRARGVRHGRLAERGRPRRRARLGRWIDCVDPDCDGDPACAVGPVEICDDGRDNNGDGWIDCLDLECARIPTCEERELVERRCADGVDDDRDGRVDCDEPDCASYRHSVIRQAP